ncbi:MAG: terminase [Prevotellaceae bacterium]|jgi:transcriptional regulator with XRE-family HTH domain|nr:terminase [Prevotellaceae bacterium]
MSTKKDIEIKKSLARFYYMEGETQKVIAQKTGISEVTLSRWVKSEEWATKRAAATLTRAEIVNNLLRKLNEYLEDTDADDINYDKLCKLAATIEKLDKKANVVDAIDVFMSFNKWMIFRQTFDSDVTPELIKAINRYQDLFITEQLGKSIVDSR